jgi:K+-transporting ATPase ATPase C chain
VVLFILLTVVTGVVYPALVTVIAQTVFPFQANGSVIEQDGQAIGSELLGQTFDGPQSFWGRPSATSPCYNGAASSGANLGPTNPAQLDAVKSRINALRAAHPDQKGLVPIDLVTASGSGLDPHISPAAAEYQVQRVARARGLGEGQARQLVAAHTQGRTLGLLGEPRVNVLKLNLALDRLKRE